MEYPWRKTNRAVKCWWLMMQTMWKKWFWQSNSRKEAWNWKQDLLNQWLGKLTIIHNHLSKAGQTGMMEWCKCHFERLFFEASAFLPHLRPSGTKSFSEPNQRAVAVKRTDKDRPHEHITNNLRHYNLYSMLQRVKEIQHGRHTKSKMKSRETK